MHDAPGGQTGDNIDDSYGYPWLFESENCQRQFCEIWRNIAEHYSDEPVILGYELLNEPHDGTDDASAWSSLQDELLSAIRSHDPERVVFIPSMGWQDYNYIKFASVNAEDDPNVMVSFHYYLPMLFSHYRMLAWQDYQGSIQYPGLVTCMGYSYFGLSGRLRLYNARLTVSRLTAECAM